MFLLFVLLVLSVLPSPWSIIGGSRRVLGELWRARSGSELTPGSSARVAAVRGLTLEGETEQDAPMQGVREATGA
jgi:membrane-bound ClpP family serine protease